MKELGETASDRKGSKESELKNYRENGNLGTRGELARAVIRKPKGILCVLLFILK